MTKVFNKVYPFATENVKGYFSTLPIKNSSILTVGSSIDQTFNAYLFGAKDITVFDINPYTKEFYNLKKQAILKVPRQELYSLLTTKEYLTEFAKQEHIPLDNIEISKDVLSEDAVTSNNLYLQSDREYDRLRELLLEKTPIFEIGNIFNIESMEQSQYDCIILSNILQYITTFYPTEDPYKILKEVLNSWKQHLTEDGIIQLLYLYSYTLDDAKNNNHPIPIYRLKDVYKSLPKERLEISWIEGTLYSYNKHNHDAIVTYQKKGR